MSHVHHQISANFVSNLPEAREVDHARIGGTACNDDLRLMLTSQLFHLIVVDQTVLRAHTILNGVEPLAGVVRSRTVGQMSASREA